MSQKSCKFILPSKDSNKLKCLDKFKIIYEKDNLNIYIESDNLIKNLPDSNKISLDYIIKSLQNVQDIFIFDNNQYKAHDIPLKLQYILSICYYWNQIKNHDDKFILLNLILKYYDILKSSISSFNQNQLVFIDNLINLLIFITTNILIQEFTLLNQNILVHKNNSNDRFFTNNNKNKKKDKSKKNILLYDDQFDHTDSEIEEDNYDYIIIDNISTPLELCFVIFKNLVESCINYLSCNKSNVSHNLIEWLIILSLRITNNIENIQDHIENEIYRKNSSINKIKWYNLSQNLFVNILNHLEIKEDNNDNNNDDYCHIFEIIRNCLINGFIDLILNVNTESSSINNSIFQKFPNYITQILSSINNNISNKIFINIIDYLQVFSKQINHKEYNDNEKFINSFILFMESLSKNKPSIILNNILYIKKIIRFIYFYKLRSSFLINITNSLIEFRKKSKTNDEDKSEIIQLIELLLERVYDKHQNCRTKSIQCIENLFINDIIPYNYFITIMKEIQIRTLDESSYVRASSLNLLRLMSRKATEDYYQMNLNYNDIENLINNINDKLDKLNNEFIYNINHNILDQKIKNENSDLNDNLFKTDSINNTSINNNMHVDNDISNNDKNDNMHVGDGINNNINNTQIEYELMKTLLIDAKEVSLIIEYILEKVCIHGIYSKVSSDVSSCILFISECISLNIKKSFPYFSNILKIIWRINHQNIINSLIHGFYIIIFNNNDSINLFNQETNLSYDIENEYEDQECYFKLNFNKMIINENSIKNLIKVLILFNNDDFINLLKLLEFLSCNHDLISKKYLQNFDINLLRKYTLNQILLLKNTFFKNTNIQCNLKILLELYIIILKVVTIKNNSICDSNYNDFEILHDIFVKSIKNHTIEIIEYAIKCFNLIKIDDKYENILLKSYMDILINNEFIYCNNSLFITIIDSVFILIGNPSNIKYRINSENNSKTLILDLFLNNLINDYLNRLKELKEIKLLELSKIVLILSHIILKYGNYIEMIYNKWKQLYSIIKKNIIFDKKEDYFCNVSIEEDYFEYTRIILENKLINNKSIFNFIIPIINFLCRDPNILVEFNDYNISDVQWQLDYLRNCGVISLCKLISLKKNLLNINDELINKKLILNLNINLEYLDIMNMSNIELIFSFIYNKSLIYLIDKTQLDDIRLNIILCTNDLLIRYPNIIDPWIEKQYYILTDNNDLIEYENKNNFKYNIMLIINYLLNIGFIKPKDTLLLSYLKCINNTKNFELYNLANSFFHEFFKDINNQFSINIIPFLINQLSLEYSEYIDDKIKIKDIIDQAYYILNFINNKDKICSSLIPRFFQRIAEVRDINIIEFYINILEFLKLNSKSKCMNKVIENLYLINNHIKEFDILKEYFNKILQNCNISDSIEMNDEALNLLKNDHLIKK